MKAVFWIQSRGIEDVAVIRMRRIEAHDFAIERVDLFMGADTES